MKIDVIWQNFLNEVAEQVSPTTYNVWFNDLSLIKMDVDKITIQVPMAVHKTMLGNTYYSLIENIFYSLTGVNYTFDFVLEEEINVVDNLNDIVNNIIVIYEILLVLKKAVAE